MALRAAFWVVAVLSLSQPAEAIVFRQGLVFNRGPFSSLSTGSVRAGNVIFAQGQLFEIGFDGLPNQIFAKASTGEIINATSPQTKANAIRMIQFLADRIPSLRPQALEFLQRNGINTPGSTAIAPSPTGAGTPSPTSTASVGSSAPPGPHGEGGTSPGAATGRTVAEIPTVSEGDGIGPAACNNLVGTVCGRANAGLAEQQSNFGKVKQLALQTAQRTNGLSTNTLVQLTNQIFANPPRLSNATVQFFGILKQNLEFAYGNLQNLGDTVKQHLLNAIDAQPFDPSQAVAMKATVSRLVVSALPNFNNFNEVRSYLRGCNFFTPNAFAVPGTDRVFMCPGMLLQAFAGGAKNFDSVLPALFQVTAHEQSHHIGADLSGGRAVTPFRGAYSKLLACYYRKAPQFVFPNGRRDGEVVADYMGDLALLQYVASTGKRGAQALDALVASMKPLCGGLGERDDPAEEHPPASFRVQMASQILAPLLGCPSVKAPCGIGGDQ